MTSQPIKQLITDFGDYLTNTKGFSPETLGKYKRNLEIIFETINILDVSDLQPEKINKSWVNKIWQLIQKSKGISDNTVRNYQSSLRSLFKFLEDNGQMPIGTHRKIELSKPTEVHISGMTHDEKVTIRNFLTKDLKSVRGRRDAALFFFMWSTGCRISEALKLNVHPDGVIYTDNPMTRSGDFSLVRGEDGRYLVYVHIQGKGKRNRSIPVSDEAIIYINFYLENRETKSPVLFMSHTRYMQAQRLKRVSVQPIIERVFTKAGVVLKKGVASHVFRHTAIDSWILSGRYTPLQIIAMTGHANVDSLEPYFRRSQQLTRDFAIAGNPLNIPGIGKDVKNFEDLLKKRYLRK